MHHQLVPFPTANLLTSPNYTHHPQALPSAVRSETDPFLVANGFASYCTSSTRLLPDYITPVCSAASYDVSMSLAGNLAKRPAAICARLGACKPTTNCTAPALGGSSAVALDACTANGLVGGAAVRADGGLWLQGISAFFKLTRGLVHPTDNTTVAELNHPTMQSTPTVQTPSMQQMDSVSPMQSAHLTRRPRTDWSATWRPT